MKAYTYKCKECKKKFEIELNFGDDLPETLTCEKCGAVDSAKHDFTECLSASIHKGDFDALNDSGMDYTKLPKKRLY